MAMEANAYDEPAWLHGHAHEPNPEPPSPDATLIVQKPDQVEVQIEVADLQKLPLTQVDDCWIVSTGHGASGPFTFGGARLVDLLDTLLNASVTWQYATVISADGFGTRIQAKELRTVTLRPILLAYQMNGAALTRAQGLVRLIVPSETDDALRQVKWVGRIELD
jgi:DMSO/TMAO reductase YedYZ molybdopterin-dependent catalytic subunit